MTGSTPRAPLVPGTTDTYPVLPLRDIVVFPHMIVPLFVGREKSIRALEEVVKNDGLILLATQKNAGDDDPETGDIYEIGTLARVLQLLKLPDSTVKAPDDRRTGAIFREVEPEDLLKIGLIPEFVGRLPVLATLEDLDEAALKTILTEPKNALVKQYQRLFEMEDTELTFTDEAVSLIARKAIERKTGARGLRSIMEGILLETMYELPGLEGVEQVVIGPEAVETKSRPLFIYSDREEEAKSASA